MPDTQVTTAALVRFTEALEERSTVFYTALAQRWPEHRATFERFAQEGRRNKTHVLRTYQETVSDALETSYSFAGLNPQAYVVETELAPDAAFGEALQTAIELEERACAFYTEVAERSESLLATIPRAFRRVVKTRSKRKDRLEALV